MKENQLIHAGQGAPALTMAVGDMTQLARAVAASKLFGMQTPDQALVLMALCQSEGKNPIQAVRQYHIINGKPSMRADAMLAEFQSRGGVVEWLERSNTSVSATFTHPSGGSITVTWTLKDAEAAQLMSNAMWKKYPRQMLTARVISEAIRTILPGVVAGIYTPEEVQDYSRGEMVVIAPEDVEDTPLLPAAPPKTPPLKRFMERAQQINPAALTPEGKLSKPVALALLSECYGQEITTLSLPSDHVAWEGHLAALLAVYPVETPASPEPPLDDLSDPFADEE